MEVVIRCQLLQPFVSLLGDMNTTGGSIMTDDKLFNFSNTVSCTRLHVTNFTSPGSLVNWEVWTPNKPNISKVNFSSAAPTKVCRCDCTFCFIQILIPFPQSLQLAMKIHRTSPIHRAFVTLVNKAPRLQAAYKAKPLSYLSPWRYNWRGARNQSSPKHASSFEGVFEIWPSSARRSASRCIRQFVE